MKHFEQFRQKYSGLNTMTPLIREKLEKRQQANMNFWRRGQGMKNNPGFFYHYSATPIYNIHKSSTNLKERKKKACLFFSPFNSLVIATEESKLWMYRQDVSTSCQESVLNVNTCRKSGRRMTKWK